MPRLEPFAGLRYDSSRLDLGSVIAPPYDVVDEQERSRLAARHRANAVHLELPQPDRRRGLDRYQHASALLADWEQSGTLVRDAHPALYPYRMTTPEGRATDGVIGALSLDPADTADVLPHEQTLPKPMSDRLDLLRATRANLSPIWGLSLSAGLTGRFTVSAPPAATATDDEGVLHELWVLDDPATVTAVSEGIAASPVVVADGHHRYETALRYREEVVGIEGGGSGASSIMALVVELSDDQLAVGTFHRALSGLPEGLDLVEAFSSWFDVTRAGPADERTLAALAEAAALALVMPSGAWLLTPRDGTAEAAGSALDASMVALPLAVLPDHELEFLPDWHQVGPALGSQRAQAVVLLRPVTVAQIAAWARERRRMPPKTTYFHPKPRTGMVFRTLDIPAGAR